MATGSVIRKNQYYDSVFLMGVNKRLSDTAGVQQTAVLMGTEKNKELLAIHACGVSYLRIALPLGGVLMAKRILRVMLKKNSKSVMLSLKMSSPLPGLIMPSWNQKRLLHILMSPGSFVLKRQPSMSILTG